MLMSTGHHSRESGYDHEVFTSWIVRGAEKKRCRAALTLCMQPQELGWNAAPSVVAQWPAAGMDACAAGALQPIGHEESAMRGGESGLSARAQPVCRGPCVHVWAWSPLGPTVCGYLHESVSMTEKPVAERHCPAGMLDAKRTRCAHAQKAQG